MIKPFDGFAIRKTGQLIVEDFRGYETRNESTIALIRQAIEKHDVADFDWILVNTGDETISGKKPNHPLFSYCTDTDNFDFCCPDFIFDHWRQTGLDDYEETRLRISAMDEPPLTDTLGWRGANTHPSRVNLVENFKSPVLDLEWVHWNRQNPDKLSAPNFLSFEDQIRKFRYLIDVEGKGYSARLKLLLASPRVVFVQDRPYKGICFASMKAWEHYVPVRRDFSNLPLMVQYISLNPQLEESIKKNARAYAAEHLSRAAAVKKWAELLSRHAGPPTRSLEPIFA